MYFSILWDKILWIYLHNLHVHSLQAQAYKLTQIFQFRSAKNDKPAAKIINLEVL